VKWLEGLGEAISALERNADGIDVESLLSMHLKKEIEEECDREFLQHLEPLFFPSLSRPAAGFVPQELIKAQPMEVSTGPIFYLDYQYKGQEEAPFLPGTTSSDASGTIPDVATPGPSEGLDTPMTKNVWEMSDYELSRETFTRFRELCVERDCMALDPWSTQETEVRMSFAEAVQSSVIDGFRRRIKELEDELMVSQMTGIERAFPPSARYLEEGPAIQGQRSVCYYCLRTAVLREYACDMCRAGDR